MVKTDGNLSPWIEAQEASIGKLSSEIRLAQPGWYRAFTRSLEENPDAERLRTEILPRCQGERLAMFVVQAVAGRLDERLLELTRKRGEDLRKTVYPAARKERSAEARTFVERAGKAFDVRRQGLAEYSFSALIIERYLTFRSGTKPTARELALLFKAGLAVAGRPAHLQTVDYDRLRRNLKNYEANHPHP